MAESNVEASQRDASEGKAQPSPVAVAEVAENAGREILIHLEFRTEVGIPQKHPAHVTETDSVDPNPPAVEEIKLDQPQPVFAVDHHAAPPEEAILEEAAEVFRPTERGQLEKGSRPALRVNELHTDAACRPVTSGSR